MSRYGQQRKLTSKMRKAIEYRAFEATLTLTKDADPPTETMNPTVYLSTVNTDTMYFHKAMKQFNAPQFINMIGKEINEHVERKN